MPLQESSARLRGGTLSPRSGGASFHPSPFWPSVSFDQSFLHPDAEKYAVGLTPLPFPAVMERMEREIQREDQPAVGRLTGSVLRMLVAANRAQRVLEVGCNVGYSALWLAGGLPPGGALETIEVKPDLARRAEANFREAGVGDRVRVHVGTALDVLPRLDGPFDVVFLDAVKSEYEAYLDLALPRMRPGGVVAADNMFWLGRAWGKARDEDTLGVRRYARRVMEDPRFASALVPVEDGLMVSVLRA